MILQGLPHCDYVMLQWHVNPGGGAGGCGLYLVHDRSIKAVESTEVCRLVGKTLNAHASTGNLNFELLVGLKMAGGDK